MTGTYGMVVLAELVAEAKPGQPRVHFSPQTHWLVTHNISALSSYAGLPTGVAACALQGRPSRTAASGKHARMLPIPCSPRARPCPCANRHLACDPHTQTCTQHMMTHMVWSSDLSSGSDSCKEGSASYLAQVLSISLHPLRFDFFMNSCVRSRRCHSSRLVGRRRVVWLFNCLQRISGLMGASCHLEAPLQLQC